MRLGPVLFYLECGEFVQENGGYYALKVKGFKTIISFFQKFVIFIKQQYPESLSSWIGQFDVNINNNWPRARNVFFFIKTESEVEKAFIEYLKLFNDLHDIDKLDLSSRFYLPLGYTYLRNECNVFFSDNSKYGRNTFIMTKFDRLNTKLRDNGANIYRDIRCGLAHSYLIAQNANIDAITDHGDHGIVFDTKNNWYIFYVKTYFEEFKCAVNQYMRGLVEGSENQDLFKDALKGKAELI